MTGRNIKISKENYKIDEGCSELIAKAKKSNLFFSQVREDPKIDESILPGSLEHCAIIASGGDTVAYILGKNFNKISKIFVVDPNPAQIALTKLKIYLLRNSTEERLKILGYSEMNVKERENSIKKICNELGIEIEIFGSIRNDFALDLSGRYEILFEYMRNHLSTLGFDSEKIMSLDEKSELGSNEQFKEALEKSMKIYFDLQVLIELFGENATTNPVDEFYEHFYNVTMGYLSRNQMKDSPFTSQLLVGKFLNNQYYDWLYLDALKEDLFSKVIFVNQSMESFLSKNTQKLDFIHLSNITDWLNQDSSNKLIKMAYDNLNNNGSTIVRILNSNSMFNHSDFIFDDEMASSLLSKDRSFFYRMIKVGIKQDPFKFYSDYIDLAEEASKKVNFFASKMFLKIESDELDYKTFVESQKKFYYAVDYFSRPMSALISRIDDYHKRKIILENIVEEHGDFNFNSCHSRTFKKFLKSIGAEETTVSEEVDEFNAILMNICLSNDLEVAYGALGIIEYLFSFISNKIGKYVLKKHWAKDDIIYHYSAHEILDVKHSVDLFTLVSKDDLKDPKKRSSFVKGLNLGASCFKNLYDRIYN